MVHALWSAQVCYPVRGRRLMCPPVEGLAGTDKLSPADLGLITPGSHLTCAGVHILSVPPRTFHADRLPDADWVQGFDMLVLIVLLALLDSNQNTGIFFS